MLIARRSARDAAAILVFLTLLHSGASHAYRNDNGFLPGSNECALHPVVTLTTPANSAPVPNPLLGEFSNGFFHVGEIADGLYYATDGVYQSMIMISPRGIVLVDAPPSIGVNSSGGPSVSYLDVVYSIPAAQGLAIKKLIYTHSHLDHIGAASLIKDAFPSVRIIAHKKTRQQIRRGTGSEGPFLQGSGALPPPLPNRVFSRRSTVRLGHQTLKLVYKGPIHEPGNIFVYAPRQRVLMFVDVVFPGWSPFDDLALAENKSVFIRGHDKILDFDFDTLISGHLNRLGTPEDVEESRQYILDIKDNARSALFDPSLFAIFGVPSPDVPGAPLGATNALGAFSIYLDQVACRCANLTLNPDTTPSGTDWLSRFGAADRNTVGHCWQMAEALRIEPDF